jgi:transcriptional regulator with XRE-family HTH domain
MLDQQERTAAWLARKTGFDPSLVTRILSGERRPSDAFKGRAAEALGVPVALLFPEPRIEAAS